MSIRWLKIFAIAIFLYLVDGEQNITKITKMASILHRPVRSLSYLQNSNMGIFFALSTPLREPFNTVSLSYFFEASYGLPVDYKKFPDDDTYPEIDNRSDFNVNATNNITTTTARRDKRSIDRTIVYTMMSNKFESAGFPGHECLLRSICEASEHPPLGYHNGLLGDVLRIVFTPSSSRIEERMPAGVMEAETNGRRGNCIDYRSNCGLGLFDVIGVLL